MKIQVKIFLYLITSFLCISCEKHIQSIPENVMVGTWKFIKVDSCRQGVYPNAQIYRTTIPKNDGTITFLKNGTGSLNSSLVLYCNYSSFTWQYQTDSLLINTEAYPYNACINFPSKDSISIRLESCLPRLGVTVWYEVLTSRAQ